MGTSTKHFIKRIIVFTAEKSYNLGHIVNYSNLMSKILQSQDDLIQHLKEQFSFLKASSKAYDDGHISEAKRLAVIIRVLLHDTSHSLSLLSQLNKKEISFFDTASPYEPRNLLSYNGLTIIGLSQEKGIYLPRFSGPPRPGIGSPKLLPFTEWWESIVVVDMSRNQFSRRDLILSLCNKDGGAHIDPQLDSAYAALTRNASMGLAYQTTSTSGLVESIELASVRQIAHEVIMSLKHSFPEYFTF